MNGHSGGGFSRTGAKIRIYINSNLSESEKAHVIAHELVHIADDFEIDQSLKNYFSISAAAKDFITNHKANGIQSFDEKVVSYVLGTLFCAEARAYTKNQNLAEQGLTTTVANHGSELSQLIDQNYIQQFGTSYGNSTEQMKNWCLERNSMSEIQSALVW